MRKVTWAALAAAVVIAAGMAAAQRGQGRGMCPSYGMSADGGQTTASVAQPGQGRGVCPFGTNAPMGPGGGWWTQVRATTPQEKAFLDQVTQLHQAIRQARLDLAQTSDATQREAKRAEITGLQTKLHDVQITNLDLMRQMMSRISGNDGGPRSGLGRGNGARSGRGGGWGHGNGAGRGMRGTDCGFGCGGCGLGCPFGNR